MRRFAIWLLIAALMLGGCSSAQQEDPFRVDTVVQIPVDPTDAPTEAPTEPATEAPAEEAAEASTEPEETTAPKTNTSSNGSSSGKGSSGGKTSSGKTQTKETEPPATETVPAETLPPTEAPTEPPYDPSSYSIGSLEYALLDELNACRAEAGEGELTISGKLSGIAWLRAKEAVSHWSHTRPDGRDFTSALSDYGYSYGSVVELMIHSTGDGDAAWVVEKWMNTKSHSANICSSEFSQVGIGVYRSGGVTYVVCLLVG